ncbi:hypothetical protein ACFQL0_21635 [Haloplanus litoreus]|uniref:Uncharacterized protein n=1 Tax=Haloplanus litoreus TaxID=767515 RepID=A0ABD5ZT66_9EURY
MIGGAELPARHLFALPPDRDDEAVTPALDLGLAEESIVDSTS